MLDAPNRPPNKGRSGSFIGEFNEEYPRIPVARKITNAAHILFSLNIIYRDMKINMNGI